MSARAEELADRFEQSNKELISTIEAATDAQWRAKTIAEGWSVGVTAHHIASAHQAIAEVVQSIANGQWAPLPTAEMLDQMNAQHAKQYASCTREETLELARQGGAGGASIVRGLSDEQLERTGPAPVPGGAPMSAENLIEMALIGHVQVHLTSIRAAMQ